MKKQMMFSFQQLLFVPHSCCFKQTSPKERKLTKNTEFLHKLLERKDGQKKYGELLQSF